MLCYKYFYMTNICYINSVILYLHQQTNQTTSIMTISNKGLRLLLRWRIMRRRQQRRRRVRQIRRASVERILDWKMHTHRLPHPPSSRMCVLSECVFLKEYRLLLAKQGYRVGVEEWTDEVPNCKECIYRQHLTRLKALQSHLNKLAT